MITKEILEKAYLTDGKSMHECADLLGVSVGTIFNYMKRYDIKSRPKMNDKTRQKISDSMMGRPSKRKGYHLSAETKDKISKSHTGKFSKASEFGGHKKKRKDGYIAIYCPNHPMATKDGYVLEHILIMEKAIGRNITRDEVVHHKNHKRDDNRLENLELMTFREHARLHMKERWENRKEKNHE